MGESLWAFLVSVGFISMTGVMTPGPVTASAIALSRNRRWAGVGVGAGHCLVEVPILAVLIWGSGSVMQEPVFQRVLGISGGLVMAWMGISMIRERTKWASHQESTSERAGITGGPLRVGILTSLGNPYIFLWWATVGAGLVAAGERFGPAGLAGMAVVHWFCDLGWGGALGVSSHGILGKLPPRGRSAVFGVCGLALVGFGARFFLMSVL